MSLKAKCQRTRQMLISDKRLWAAAIAYLIPAVAIALLESLPWTASVIPVDPFFSSPDSTTTFQLSVLSNFILRILGLLLAVYIIADPTQYKYSTQAFGLGAVTGFAVAQLSNGQTSPLTKMFSAYLYAIANFHFSEFFVTGMTNPESLKPDSFLLNHSRSYWTAVAASCAEFFVEAFLFPNFYSTWISLTGVLVCIIGEVLRKLAMCHASVGFTHQIAIRKKRNHTLITSGVYAWCRHPGYLGWWLWSVGTQLIICNPLCAIAYACVTYGFFDDRIYDEERYLIEFFGQRYVAYQQRVPTGIPGIRGFIPVTPRRHLPPQ